MKQHYDKYSNEDFEVWKILFNRQIENLKDKASLEYLSCLEKLAPVLKEEEIPVFDRLSELLKIETGWGISVVPGLIPVDEFFVFLSNRQFCSSTWLRKKSQLDYLEEPDMFHDIFGHTPLLLNKRYADFMEEVGKIGVKYANDENIVVGLQRLYWFTIEFGLVANNGNKNIYGAGILSSFGESNHVIDDEVEVLPFDLIKIFKNDFINSEIQTRYYMLESMDQLYDSLGEIETTLIETFVNN